MPSPPATEPATGHASKPRLRPADALAALALTIVLLALSAIALAIAAGASGGAPGPLASLFASLAALALPAILALGLRGGVPLRPPSPRGAVASVLAGAGVFLVSASLTGRLYDTGDGSYAQAVEAGLRQLLATLGPVGFVIVLAGLVPLVEELMFRGVVQTAFADRGPWAAVGVGAVLFGLYHLHPIHALVGFTVGVVCGMLVWRTGSWWTGVIAHATNNAVVGTSLSLGRGDPSGFLPWPWALAGAGAVVLAIRLTPRRRKN